MKKFADKFETNKTIKSLEVSVKQLLDMNQKRLERAENWLLAKKPIGANSCASCETFIGDLTESKEYIPWNKLRQSGEKMYRLGAGFSKMLQMVNVDGSSNHSNNIYHQFVEENLHLIDNRNPSNTQEGFNIKNKGQKENLPKILKTKQNGGVITSVNSVKKQIKPVGGLNQNLQLNNVSIDIPEYNEIEEDNENMISEPKM